MKRWRRSGWKKISPRGRRTTPILRGRDMIKDEGTSAILWGLGKKGGRKPGGKGKAKWPGGGNRFSSYFSSIRLGGLRVEGKGNGQRLKHQESDERQNWRGRENKRKEKNYDKQRSSSHEERGSSVKAKAAR